MIASRIPDFSEKSFGGMSMWFSAMSARGILFHPDDSPEEIVSIPASKRMFNSRECQKLETIVGEMFKEFGDGVYEAAYPFFMKCIDIRPDA
jgi:hypothetical protein